MIKLKIFFMILVFTLPLTAQDTTHILIVYFSKTGHTRLMAENVAKSARSVGKVSVKLLAVDKATNKDVLEADGIVLGSPVYNANVAPALQNFINNWPFEGAPLKNKIGAAFVTAGGVSTGEELVQLNILHSMLVFGMIVVGGGNWQSAFGASAITGEEPFDTKGRAGEVDDLFLQKAKDLGKRVAEVAKKLM